MAQRVRTPAAALQQHFQHNIAVVVGINRYENVRPLHTAEPDARYLAALLEDEAGRRDPLDRYKVIPAYNEDATCAKLTALLKTTLPDEVRRAGAATRVIFYFAGHGDAGYTDNTIKGYLFPQDARPREQEESERRLLAMDDVQKWLVELDCQHVLIILDCCSAGAMPKTSATRSALLPPPLYWETLQRYVSGKTRQAITSAAHNQQASDIPPDYSVGERDPDEGADHSPFALALFEALAADPLHDGRDLRGAGRDGVVTATELYLNISDSLYRRVGDSQTPGLWTLNQGHEAGDYVFLLPGAQVQLEPAPDLTGPEHDPWPQSGNHDLAQALIAASREAAIRELNRRVEAKPLVAVTGRSDSGKTSLVLGMLLPRLQEGVAAGSGQGRKTWQVLPPLRLETQAPVQALIDHLGQAVGQEPGRSDGDATNWLSGLATNWAAEHPRQRLLLAVDCAEALFQAATAEEQARLWALLEGAAKPNVLHIILTVPGDRWETPAQADDQSSQALLPSADRYAVDAINPFNRDGLRQVIDQPAAAKMIFLESEQLIGRMLDAVEGQPAALPLLTETLHRMYMRHATGIKSGRTDPRDRTLTRAYYEAEGGVEGVIADLAQGVYDQWPDEDHRRSMQHVLMRLVKVEAGQYVGGRARQADFAFPDGQAARRASDIIAALAACGLVAQGADAAGEPYVELGHSGLITAWPQMQKWLVEQGAEWALQRDLTARVEEWQRASLFLLPLRRNLQRERAARIEEWRPRKPKTLLWDDDPRLPQVEATLWPAAGSEPGLWGRLRWEWRVLFPPKNEAPDATAWVNRGELAFVRASVSERSGFRQKLLGAVAAFVIAVVALSGLAWWQRGVAVENETKAVAAVTAEATARAGAEEERNKAQLAATAEATARIYADQKRVEAEVAATKEATARAGAEEERIKAELAATAEAYAKARAVANEQIAREKQAEAEREAALASSRELAARSALELAAGRLETAQLLAIQSGQITGTVQAFDAIRSALQQPGRAERINYLPIGCQISQPGEVIAFRELKGLELRDPDTGDPFSTLPYPFDGFYVRAFRSPDSKRVLTVDEEGNALIWNIQTGKYITLDHSRPMRTYTDQQGQVIVLENDFVAAFVDDSTLQGPLLGGAWDPSGSRVATTGCSQLGSSDVFCGRGGARVWDAATGKPLVSLIGHSDWVCEAQWLADGAHIRTVSRDGTERQWAIKGGSELPSLSRQEGEAQAVPPAKPACNLSPTQIESALKEAWTFFQDWSPICVEDRLWLTGLDGVALSDGLTGENLELQIEPVFDAEVGPDGRSIALARCNRNWDLGSISDIFCDKGILEVRDARTGGLIVEIAVPGRKATLVSWSQDGGHLLYASDDGEKVWMSTKNPRLTVVDTVLWKEILAVSGLSKAPYRIAWAADGNRFLAFDNKAVHQYFLLIGDLIRAACIQTPRNFTWDEWNRLAKGDYRPTCAEAPIPPDVIEAIHNQARNHILAGDLDAAKASLDQLNSWLADSGQLERYGVDPATFIEDTQSEAKN